MKKILVLFPNDWDKTEFSKPRYAGLYKFVYYGNNLFSFPHFLKLPFINVSRIIEKLCKKVRTENFDSVLSSDEYIGAIIAAGVAKKLGLGGANPADIILSQHKYYCRLQQQINCPEASVDCQLIPQKIDDSFTSELAYPFFVKPVKGTFSLFAKKVNSAAELTKHLSFNWYERIVLRSITKPFNQLLRKFSALEYDANFFIGEELIDGVQVTLDGFVWENDVTICGIVDSIMFEGTNIFERFEYPSKLKPEVQERMNQIVSNLITGMKFDQLQFNVELFYNYELDSIHIIEINPRLSYQFGDLYENVDGMNTYQILLDLSQNKKPKFTKSAGQFEYTASFVLRTFKGKELKAIPQKGDIDDFNQRYPESNIRVYGKKGTKMSNEMRAIGSYRYGIVNVGAHSLLDLFAIFEDVKDSLPFKFK